MKFFPSPLLRMVYLVLIPLFLFSCTKDSDLFMDAVMNDPAKELEERTESNTEEKDNDASEEANSSTDSSADSTADGTTETNTEESSAAEGEMVTKTFTFSAIQDAHLEGSKGYNQDLIRIEENNRQSYLMFDLSDIEGTILSATLLFTVYGDNGDGTIMVEKAIPTEWTESNLTASNAPVADIEVGAIQKQYATGSTEKIELSSPDIQPEVTTLILKHKAGNDLAIASRENSAVSGPKLIVTYETYQGAADPDTGENASTEEYSTGNNSADTSDYQDNTSTGYAVDYYVTASGSGYNDGKSEQNAWSIEHAFKNAKPGDVIAIKAGNYGNVQLNVDNSGYAGNLIKFVGYTNVPGDLESYQGSTHTYGSNLDANKMPLLNGGNSTSGTALTVDEKFIHIENIQITNYVRGVRSLGTDVTYRNVILTNLGNQNVESAYDGIGFEIMGDRTELENCFVLNATAEAIKFYDSDYSRANYCSVYADGHGNPTDYYFLITGGTNNTIIENSYAERAKGLEHGGHGFDMKDLAENNTFRNCTVRRTQIELNFSGVRNNLIEDCKIYGEESISNQWHARLAVLNGANNNTVRNIYIQDTWAAMYWGDYDDGYIGPNGDRDAVSCGYDNIFDGITVRNTERILNIGGGNFLTAKASNNVVVNSDFADFDYVAATYYTTENILFKNTKFDQGRNLFLEAGGQYAPYSKFDVRFDNCTWTNVNFTPPN